MFFFLGEMIGRIDGDPLSGQDAVVFGIFPRRKEGGKVNGGGGGDIDSKSMPTCGWELNSIFRIHNKNFRDFRLKFPIPISCLTRFCYFRECNNDERNVCEAETSEVKWIRLSFVVGLSTATEKRVAHYSCIGERYVSSVIVCQAFVESLPQNNQASSGAFQPLPPCDQHQIVCFVCCLCYHFRLNAFSMFLISRFSL